MTELSVVIITFNEEKNIARCLDSITQIADEIIVVDSFSTDNTKAICNNYKVSFIQHEFEGYIEQKNFALTKASYENILCLDADEALSDELITELLKIKKTGFTADAYTMNRCSFFCGKWIKHGSWYPDTKLRLFKKSKGHWGGTNPHDKIVMQQSTTKQHIQADILHYSYYSLAEVITQNNRFTSIQAQAMFKQGKKASYIKLIINPLFAFINGFIFKGGFLDGVDGFFIASSIAYQTMTKYAKLMQLQKNTMLKQ